MTRQEVQITARVSPELKKLVDADERYNQDVVESALWREFGGSRDTTIDREIEYHEQRLELIDQSIENLEKDRQEVLDVLEPLYRAREERESKLATALQRAEDVLRPEMLDPSNDAVQRFADQAELSPEQFIKHFRERQEGDDGR